MWLLGIQRIARSSGADSCLKGYNGEQISLELNEIIGYPKHTSIEGGYDIRCTLKIDVGCYHVECDTLYSAKGALYRFSDELKNVMLS